jgi:hypothetical protein
MLNLIANLIKFALFSTFILVLGNSIHWRGKTISDQVKLSMAHAERSEVYGAVRNWTERLTHDAKKSAARKANQVIVDEILPSERQKLNALIRELNNSHKTD